MLYPTELRARRNLRYTSFLRLSTLTHGYRVERACRQRHEGDPARGDCTVAPSQELASRLATEQYVGLPLPSGAGWQRYDDSRATDIHPACLRPFRLSKCALGYVLPL